MTSVAVLARHLPARIKNGTSDQRHESISSLTAAKVSTWPSRRRLPFHRGSLVLAAHDAVWAPADGSPAMTLTFSSRIPSGELLPGGSIASIATTWSMWFWITSRIAPASS